MIRFHLLHNESRLEIEVTTGTRLIDIFNHVKEKFGIESDRSAFVFWHFGTFPIDDRPIGAIQFQANRLTNVVLIEKENMAFIESFGGRVLPSLVVESALFNSSTRNVLSGVQTTHTLAKNHADLDVMAQCFSVIPFDRIEVVEGEAKVEVLVKWFKEEFFEFVRKFKCRVCGCDTNGENSGPVTPSERLDGATRAEVYRCVSCGAVTRFPRYNSVPRLLQTRKGRCGEWANCFCAIMRALEYDVRLVNDWTDHIWVEFWSEDRQRYVHIDPCEGIIDKPLVYEEGWGKKLLWIVAIGEHQCVDVTRKYTRKMNEVIDRRGSMVDEAWFRKMMSFINEVYMQGADDETVDVIKARQAIDEQSMAQMRSETVPEEQRPRISGTQ